MTGVMSRVVTIGAIFPIICGFVPKIGAVVSPMPIEVLGGGVILMFGMVICWRHAVHGQLDASQYDDSGDIHVVGIGLQAVPKSMQHLPDTLGTLMTSGLLPVGCWPLS